jgi:flagellin FlaB
MVGIEAAIVLIAFVIVASAFSFMVVNMGLFSTQRGRETIQDSILEASSLLMIDGSLNVRATSGSEVDAIVIPLKIIGVRSISIFQASTVTSLRVENHTALANIYDGINTTDPAGQTFNDLVSGMDTNTGAKFFIGNSDGDSSLDYDEKGLLVIYLASSNQASEREHIFVEIRLEKGAPLTIEFIVPPQLTQGWLVIGG